MKHSQTLSAKLVVASLVLMMLFACVMRGQSLKLDIRVVNEQDNYVMTDIQVKEVMPDGAEVLRTFKTKKGKLIIPLDLGKKYVLHFWAPGKQFKSVIVDCTEKSLNTDKTYTFGFDILLPEEVPDEVLPKELVAMIWIAYNGVQYKLL